MPITSLGIDTDLTGVADVLGNSLDAPEPLSATDYIDQYKTAKEIEQTASVIRGLYDAALVGADTIAEYPSEFAHLAGYSLTPEAFAGAEKQIADMYESLGLDAPTNTAPEAMLQELSTLATQQEATSQQQFFDTLKGLEQTAPAEFQKEIAALPVADQLKYDFMKYTAGDITKEQYSQTALQRLEDAGVSEFQKDAQGNLKQLNLFNNFGSSTPSTSIAGIGEYTHEVAGPSALERMTSNPLVSLGLALVPGIGGFLSAGLGALNMAATGNITPSNALQLIGGVAQGISTLQKTGATLSVAEQQAAESAYEAGFKVFQETGDSAAAYAAETAALKATQPGLLTRIAEGAKNIDWGNVADVARTVSGLPSYQQSDVFTGQYEAGTGGMVHQIPTPSGGAPATAAESAGGAVGGAGGGGTAGGEIAPAGSTEPSPWMYPNEQIITESATPVSQHTNPDGSIVAVFSDGSTQWQKPPTDFSQWPKEPTVPAPPAPTTAPVESPITVNILDWLRRHPNATDTERRAVMEANKVTPEDVARATGVDIGTVQSRYEAAGTSTGADTGTGAGTGAGTGTGTGTGDGTGTATYSGIPGLPRPRRVDAGPPRVPGTGGTGGAGSGTGTGTGTGTGAEPEVEEPLPATERTTQMVFDPLFKFDRTFGMIENLVSPQNRPQQRWW